MRGSKLALREGSWNGKAAGQDAKLAQLKVPRRSGNCPGLIDWIGVDR